MSPDLRTEHRIGKLKDMSPHTEPGGCTAVVSPQIDESALKECRSRQALSSNLAPRVKDGREIAVIHFQVVDCIGFNVV